MLPLVLAAALAGQYPTPQYQAPMQQYSAPPPIMYSVPAPTYAAPVQTAAPQLVILGAGQVVGPGPFDRMLGHIGQSLLKHSWPRVQPVAAMQQAPAPVAQVVYVAIQQQQPVMQASYVVQAPQVPMAGIPTYGSKAAPQQATYGTPQAPQQATYGAPQQGQPAGAPQAGPAPKPSETVPPVPPR